MECFFDFGKKLYGGVEIVNSVYKGRTGVLDFPYGIQDQLIFKINLVRMKRISLC